MKCLHGMLCCSNLSFHCSHLTQANGNYRCVFYMDPSLKSSEIAVSYNLKTWVPSLPACFEFSLVMHPSKIHFIETLHLALLVRGENLLKFFLSLSANCRWCVFLFPAVTLWHSEWLENTWIRMAWFILTLNQPQSKPICVYVSFNRRKLSQLQSEWILYRFLSLSNYFLHLISCWLALSSLSSSALPSIILLLP